MYLLSCTIESSWKSSIHFVNRIVCVYVCSGVYVFMQLRALWRDVCCKGYCWIYVHILHILLKMASRGNMVLPPCLHRAPPLHFRAVSISSLGDPSCCCLSNAVVDALFRSASWWHLLVQTYSLHKIVPISSEALSHSVDGDNLALAGFSMPRVFPQFTVSHRCLCK